MIPWVQIDSVPLPDGSGDLRLKRRGAEFSIMLGTNELMNSRLSGSEEALASLSIDRLPGRSPRNILIGGLGMGFTLRAALAKLGRDDQIVVAELIPSVVAWARDPMAEIFGDSLSDPRLTIVERDVAQVIASAQSAFDAILLDVDNGPEGIVHKHNDRLYSIAGLSSACAGLRSGGILAVWSSGPDRGFTTRLRQAGFLTEEVSVRARNKRGARHVVWIAQKHSAS